MFVIFIMFWDTNLAINIGVIILYHHISISVNGSYDGAESPYQTWNFSSIQRYPIYCALFIMKTLHVLYSVSTQRKPNISFSGFVMLLVKEMSKTPRQRPLCEEFHRLIPQQRASNVENFFTWQRHRAYCRHLWAWNPEHIEFRFGKGDM